VIFRVAGLEVGLTKKYILFLIKPFIRDAVFIDKKLAGLISYPSKLYN